MDDKFFQHPGQILREGRLGLFTRSPFLPVHFHWTTTPLDSSGLVAWPSSATGTGEKAGSV